ncbi:hypothetical protein DPSP01_008125 [Paraphaeosphaeria sporulosa]|uniref:Utp8 beta-propeller domain-containing protein n=1 Tax=Paraphaeosphaeria sporulosa TaxID=1460663 RepID=A0A177C5E6_9PLEO|nr:uncharacterized protein CC84DRAFT_1150783 [Paraphaeosphaeria sporulosa]OAG02735.1 hypothetical protein CC84DRAFT_1150783 [Paraphaeosphaeria sporulosa]
MSSDQEIGAPFTLASLPHSISSRDGRTHAASVCSISGNKKRKRTEIAIGLDGEGISIYSLQNPQLVTSYALPPQTSFASAPFSVYHKGSSKRASHRYTYAFVSQNTPGAKPHLVCFAEEIRKDSTADTVKTTYTPSDTSQRIVSIDVVPVPAGASQQNTSHEVLVIFGNGDVICLSSDLEVVRWVASISNLALSSKNAFEIEHASINPARALTRGLLNNRGDIVAVLNPSLDEKSDLLDLTHVMSVIGREADGRRMVALFQLQPRSPDLLSSRLPPLKHLSAWELPASNLGSAPEAGTHQFVIHASNGTIHCLSSTGLVSYDFSGTVPKISSELSKSTLPVDSFLRISQDLLLTTSQSACQIVNVKYNSVHAERSVETSTQSPTKEGRKRKHTGPESEESTLKAPALIAYYADQGLAVGTWNSELVGFQLGESTRRKRVKSQGARLIDSLGRGIAAKTENDQEDMAKWRERVPKLDKYARKGEVARFEEIFAAELGVKLEPGSGAEEKLVNGNEVNGTNGEPSSDLPRKWILSKILSKTLSAAKRSRHQQYAAYALSRIFEWVDSPSSHGPSGYLKVQFFPPNVFEWLMHSGNLTKESIRRALLDDPSTNLGITTPFRDGDIVRAVVNFDPELHILSAILNHSHFLPVGEVVQAVKFLMQSLDDQPKPENTKLLTNGAEANGTSMDVDIASELDAASHEIDRALAMLDNGLAIMSGTLRPALMRLHTFSPNAISSTLRTMLSRHDLESLIKVLHYELKNGGWTAPYDFGDSDEVESEPSSEEIDDSAVAIIASLLSCTLDAIGPALWLTSVGDTSTDELIQELREDAEEALTGFWEARYIRGILSELLRYSSQLPKSQKPSSKALEKQGKPFALDTKLNELPILPLGSKPDLGIKKTKAGKGGQRKERSAREMGMLISKRVPKYSFERIAI